MEQTTPLVSNIDSDRGSPQSSVYANLLSSYTAYRFEIFVGVAVCMLLAIAHHFYYPRYTAKAFLLVQRAENSPLQAMMGKMTGNQSFSGKRNEYVEKYLQYLNSHEFFLAAARQVKTHPELAEQFAPSATSSQDSMSFSAVKNSVKSFLKNLVYVKIADPNASANEIEAIAASLSSGVSFQKSGQDNLIVQVQTSDYKKSVVLANFLAEAAVTTISQSELKELNDAKYYMEVELAAANKRLKEFDSAVITYRKKNSAVGPNTEAKEVLQRVSELQRSLEVNRLQFNQNQRLINILNGELQKQETQILAHGAKSLQSSGVINQLRQQIQTLRYKKMLFQAQGLGDDSAQIRSVDKDIDQIASRLKESIVNQGGTEEQYSYLLGDDKEGLVQKISSLKRENQYLGTSIPTLEKALSEASEPLKQLPEAQQTMEGFGRNMKLEFELLQEIKRKALDIELERLALDSKVRVLEKATIAGIPARFNVLPKALAAGLLAFLFGVGIAYLKDEISTAIKSRYTLNDLGMITIGSVPWVNAGAKWPLHRTGGVSDVLVPWKTDEECAEILAFKTIRAMVMKMRTQTGQPATTICVLGATPGDGKSFVSANVGLALGQMGKKTLILDCDLRRPTLGVRLGVNNDVGVTSILTEKEPIDVCITKGVLPDVDVLPSGPRSRRATELLTGPGFSRMLKELQQRYDYIVIDTPPLLPIVDGLMLSSVSDAMVFVVSHRKTKLPDIVQAIEKVRQFDNRPIFAVYNRVEDGSHYQYAYVNPNRIANAHTSVAASAKSLRDELDGFKKSWRGKKLTEETNA